MDGDTRDGQATGAEDDERGGRVEHPRSGSGPSGEARSPRDGSEAQTATDPEGRASSEEGDLRAELDEVRDRHLRLAAEFENYRKRIQSELREVGTRAQAHLVSRLLDSLDDFARITSQDPDHTTVQALLEGVQLVERKLLHSLEEAGVESVDPRGLTFDPEVMEALVRVPADGPEDDDQVDQVFQPGFLFKGHLVRPARVSVRKLDE